MNEKRDAFAKVIWRWLQEDGPSTAGELARRHTTPKLGLPRDVAGIRPRLTELAARGQVRATGEKRHGGRRGPRETVWAVVLPSESVLEDYGLR
jgi:hypothetical protein